MTFSIAQKQLFIYFTFIFLTSLTTILLYTFIQQKWILYREAEIKYDSKEYKEAIDLYKKSEKRGLPSSRIASHLANSYVSIGNFKEAITLYRSYLLEHPKDKTMRLALARALSWNGNLKESEIEYKKILDETHDKTD